MQETLDLLGDDFRIFPYCRYASYPPWSSSGSCCLATRPVWTRTTAPPWLWQWHGWFCWFRSLRCFSSVVVRPLVWTRLTVTRCLIKVIHFPVVAIHQLPYIGGRCACYVLQLPCRGAEAFPMFQTVLRTMAIPLSLFDKVVNAPVSQVVQVERVPQVPSWRTRSCSHGCTR